MFDQELTPDEIVTITTMPAGQTVNILHGIGGIRIEESNGQGGWVKIHEHHIARKVSLPVTNSTWRIKNIGTVDVAVSLEVARPSAQTAAITALHPLANIYEETVGRSLPAIQRIGAAFQLLESASLLTHLVDGCYYGSDGQTLTGMPISLRGVAAAAMTGTFTRGRYGFTTTQSDIAGIGHAIAATNSGTFFVDDTPALSASPAAFSPILSIGTTAPTTSSHQYGYALTSVPRIQSFNDAGSFVNDSAYISESATPGSNLIDPQYWHPRIHGATYGYSEHRSWHNGVRGFLVGTGFAAATAANKTRVSLFRRPANSTTFSNPSAPSQVQYVGTLTSWLLFARELNDAEARIVQRAMWLMRGQVKRLVAEGDSLTAQIFGASPTRARDNWPYQVVQDAAWADYQILNGAASGHSVAGMVSSDNFNAQAVVHRPADIYGTRVYAVSGGINDFGASGATTAASVYANLKALTARAKSFGFRTVISTIPLPDVAWQNLNSGTNGTRLAALNGLIRAGHVAGDFDYLCDAAAAFPTHAANPSLWVTETPAIHPNAAGNALWKAAFIEGVTP